MFCREDDGTNSVYIGESEGIKDRLLQHIRDYNSGKEPYYWTEAVIFVGRDLNKAFIRYLENRLVEIADGTKRYKVLTKNTYKDTVLKEADVAELEEFIENIRVLINTLGYKVLEPIAEERKETEYFYLNSKGVQAKAVQTSEGFVVLEGSQVTETITESFQHHTFHRLRSQLIAERIIENGRFQRDYIFSSPSAAGAVVRGTSTNGQTAWKTNDGKTLKEASE